MEREKSRGKVNGGKGEKNMHSWQKKAKKSVLSPEKEMKLQA